MNRSSQQPILRMVGITKRFPGVVALNQVTLEAFPGEIHAIVGENGAGKSTLMKVLVGAYQPDAGEIYLNGEKVFFRHPREAQEKGLSIIYQEFNLLPDRTVADNIYLGREPLRRGLIDRREMYKRTLAILQRLNIHHIISPDAYVRDLSVAEQQMVEIARALAFESRVLVMDEPTSALSATEIETLFELVRNLAQTQGLAVLYISHRLREVFDLAQRITVLKDGNVVNTVFTSEVTPAEVVRMMVGRELNEYFPPRATPAEIGPVALRVEKAGNARLHNITFEVRRGEIVGIAGLQGSGRTELAQALFGVVPFTSGKIEVNNQPIHFAHPKQAIQKKIGFLSEDRKREGILPHQSVRENILLAFRSLNHLLAVDRPDGMHNTPSVAELAKRVDIRTASFAQQIQFLSGGNQQKAILARWLAVDANILILDEPTRGIDVNAKAGIHKLLRQLAKQGAAILMISSELPEVIGMSDRILVMHEGTIAGSLPGGASETEVMLLAVGGSTTHSQGMVA